MVTMKDFVAAACSPCPSRWFGFAPRSLPPSSPRPSIRSRTGFVDANGVLIYYVEFGKGAPLVVAARRSRRRPHLLSALAAAAGAHASAHLHRRARLRPVRAPAGREQIHRREHGRRRGGGARGAWPGQDRPPRPQLRRRAGRGLRAQVPAAPEPLDPEQHLCLDAAR